MTKVKHKTRALKQSGVFVIWGILSAFIVIGICLILFQLRNDLQLVSVQNIKHTNEHRAWYGLEKFMRDSQSCTKMFRGKKLGDTILGPNTFGPTVGREWLNTGWVVQDIYLLRREDEVAWNVRKKGTKTAQEWNQDLGHGKIYVKVSLVPKPPEGENISLDYLLNTTSISRIFPMTVTMAEERIFTDCKMSEARQACQKMAFDMGAIAQMRLGRTPASESMKCEQGMMHKTKCFMTGDRFPIWKCE